MTVDFSINYEAWFDLENACEDFYTYLTFKDPDSAIYDAVEDNISYSVTVDDLPQEVIETCAKALRMAIGGIQMRMELDKNGR